MANREPIIVPDKLTGQSPLDILRGINTGTPQFSLPTQEALDNRDAAIWDDMMSAWDKHNADLDALKSARISGIANGVLSLGNNFMENMQVPDTTSMEHRIDDISDWRSSAVTSRGLQREAEQLSANDPTITYDSIGGVSDSDIGKNILGGIGTGASAGATFGPIGAVVGGAVGGLVSGIGSAIGRSNTRNKVHELNHQLELAKQSRSASLKGTADNINYNTSMNWIKNNNAPKLGVGYNAGVGIKAAGGSLDQPTSGFTTFNEGGTHQQNPFGGVQQGIAQDGQPNFVEEGETKYNDYIFSARIKASRNMLKKHNVFAEGGALDSAVGKSYAELSKQIAKESGYDDAPTDPIAIETFNNMIDRLMNAEEEQKFLAEQRKMANLINKLPTEQKAMLAEQMIGQQSMQAPVGMNGVGFKCGGRKYQVAGLLGVDPLVHSAAYVRANSDIPTAVSSNPSDFVWRQYDPTVGPVDYGVLSPQEGLESGDYGVYQGVGIPYRSYSIGQTDEQGNPIYNLYGTLPEVQVSDMGPMSDENYRRLASRYQQMVNAGVMRPDEMESRLQSAAHKYYTGQTQYMQDINDAATQAQRSVGELAASTVPIVGDAYDAIMSARRGDTPGVMMAVVPGAIGTVGSGMKRVAKGVRNLFKGSEDLSKGTVKGYHESMLGKYGGYESYSPSRLNEDTSVDRIQAAITSNPRNLEEDVINNLQSKVDDAKQALAKKNDIEYKFASGSASKVELDRATEAYEKARVNAINEVNDVDATAYYGNDFYTNPSSGVYWDGTASGLDNTRSQLVELQDTISREQGYYVEYNKQKKALEKAISDWDGRDEKLLKDIVNPDDNSEIKTKSDAIKALEKIKAWEDYYKRDVDDLTRQFNAYNRLYHDANNSVGSISDPNFKPTNYREGVIDNVYKPSKDAKPSTFEELADKKPEERKQMSPFWKVVTGTATLGVTTPLTIDFIRNGNKHIGEINTATPGTEESEGQEFNEVINPEGHEQQVVDSVPTDSVQVEEQSVQNDSTGAKPLERAFSKGGHLFQRGGDDDIVGITTLPEVSITAPVSHVSNPVVSEKVGMQVPLGAYAPYHTDEERAAFQAGYNMIYLPEEEHVRLTPEEARQAAHTVIYRENSPLVPPVQTQPTVNPYPWESGFLYNNNIATPTPQGVKGMPVPNGVDQTDDSSVKQAAPSTDDNSGNADYRTFIDWMSRFGNNGKANRYRTGLRYAQAWESGLNALTDILGITNQPDYSNADIIANSVQRPNHIGFTPIYQPLQYRPIDTTQLMAAMLREGASGRSSILDSANTNRATALAHLGSQNRASQEATGNLGLKVDAQNTEQRNAIATANNTGRQADAERASKTEAYNQQSDLHYFDARANALLREAMLRESIAQSAANARANVLNTFVSNLSGIGHEDWLAKNIANNPYFLYAPDIRTALTKFTGNNNVTYGAKGGRIGLRKKVGL